ncbi:MAG TPA: glycosyltransferase family 9 protein [Burkholderiales bacterium]|nr:glycosyltransferase family 9 protein [Burkholderiales bacterium]
MAPSRFRARLLIFGFAAWHRLVTLGKRRRPASVNRILIAHHLLAGDTITLIALVAKVREQHPSAEIVMTASPALAPLFASRPYGVRVVAFSPGSAETVSALRAARGFDLALVPGDNRHSWLAQALDARWIVAFDGDRPGYKSWPVDEFKSFPAAPAAWGDICTLLVDGPSPAPYSPARWPAPAFEAFDLPPGPYVVLHVESSVPLRHWENGKWRQLAERLTSRGLKVVWSAGREGESLVRDIDPEGRHLALGPRLNLAQLWHLIENAALLVTVDTSAQHLGRITHTPTVTLFGPGSRLLFGPGEFWRDAPWSGVTIDNFPCRDQNTLFKREVHWVRRCQRSLKECAEPKCMHAIGIDLVEAAIEDVVAQGKRK